MPSRFKGPLLGSRHAGDGLFEGVPLGALDLVRSRYKVWVENFHEEFADAQLILSGATVTDVGAVAANTEVVDAENRYLLLNPGTAQDTGVEVQWNIARNVTGVTGYHNVPGALTSTTTLMDNRELIWACRFGIQSDTTAWDGKALLGWFTNDTSLLSPTTGLPTVATGGGAGFHISELGVISFVGQQTAITAAGTTTGLPNVVALTAAATFQWYEAGFRIRWTDASDGTGTIDYYWNNHWIGRITNGLPMASTETYASTVAILNGPARDSDLAVEWMMTAITKAGHTNTSSL